MKNHNYDPEKAHLPSPEDKKRWKAYGRAKEMRERKRVTSTIAKFDRWSQQLPS